MSGALPVARWRNPFVAALVVAVLQTAVIGYMIESRASILRNGKDVLLRSAPIDPRDLLRGDYVTLSYDISRISPDVISGALPEGATKAELFVRLKQQPDGFWGPVEASFSPLAQTTDSIVIRSLPFSYYPSSGAPPSTFYPNYGIERYYVPEGEGRVLENARSAHALSVNVRVDPDGRAQIRQVSVDGAPIYQEPLY
ncbi:MULTISPECIES: GDYXXLXY domain-containing protein [unclassified Sinorhizobium]|uniref:GDYXXLXY domain-containing protein n=1 Tax=unclassified Sinorhizobium TaxID=2613772 RepID=UPI0024C3EAB6|nr:MULTISPECIES: GDYXXLXY domain-containing protein [unclassified Sinorhizobium]MDK1376602.1 GDYXXLXY domain-containing protein [Sinorhizobium sp. 6-70]MDK1477120.1 GDYXXLXY domain-containing protein [Sinorhizobium sp. 6-117]MDK1477211.1 GDYXXLXY domain-containing protein [Sinorhizobium sp. 6-117]